MDIEYEYRKFVVFTMDATQPKWWQPFLKKPFYHVLIIHTWFDGIKHWVEFEDPIVPRFCFGKVKRRDRKIFEVTYWWSFLKKYYDLSTVKANGITPRIVEMKIKLDKYNSLHKLWMRIPLCTSYVKSRLGVASFAITPYQLYRTLRKRGGVNVFCSNL